MHNNTRQDELMHYGVLGMKWGKRKNNYHSTGVKSAIAKRSNKKVDKSFDEWKKNEQKKSNAIDLGKKATGSKLAYEGNKSDKDLKKQYKQDSKAYKKALHDNTTYRKGQIKKEVGSDRSRKYLSEAKKVKKQMTADPSNKQLQKKYNDLMSKHDVERARARKAPKVAANRSKRKANFKRFMTMSVKSVAGTAAIVGGTYVANRYLSKHNVTLDGKPIRADLQKVNDVIVKARKAKNYFRDYMYF